MQRKGIQTEPGSNLESRRDTWSLVRAKAGVKKAACWGKTAVQRKSYGDPQAIPPQVFIFSGIGLWRNYLRKGKEPLERSRYSELRQVQ